MKQKLEINEEGRECSRCNKFKIWDCFAKNKQSAIGYTSACKACTYQDKAIIEKKSKTYNKTNYEIKTEPLPTQSWANDPRTAKHTEYWETENVVQIGMNPAQSFYDKRIGN